MDELKNALKDAGLNSVPLADVFGFDPDCTEPTCSQGCTNCSAGCTQCYTGSAKQSGS